MSSACITDGAMTRALAALATGKRQPKPTPEPTHSRVRARKAKRGLLSAERGEDKRRTVIEHRAVDEFGEMGARKRAAAAQARENGHQLGPWHKRGDAYGRQDAYCVDCNFVLTCCVEEPVAYGLPLVYGNALTKPCSGSK